MRKKEFYTTGEVAKMVGMSSTTIFRAIGSKTLKAATTPGGHYRIRHQDLEEFLRKNNLTTEVLEPRTRCVLIVEDNPAERRMFERALGTVSGFEIKATSTGYMAGFLTKSLKPDLILLDIFLNEGDGRDVARLIRSDPELKHTKIVAISATSEPEVIREIKACGVDSFVKKPISPEELRKTVLLLLE